MLRRLKGSKYLKHAIDSLLDKCRYPYDNHLQKNYDPVPENSETTKLNEKDVVNCEFQHVYFNIFQLVSQDVITEKCDLEQIVFVALIGKDVVSSAGKEIHQLIHCCGMCLISS